MSNAAVFASLTAEVGACQDCAQLQAIVDRAFNMLIGQQNALVAQQAILAGIAGLLSAPASPTAAVTWISSFISDVLTPQYAAYTKMVAAEATLAADVASLITAITNAATRIGGGCSISIPPL